MSDTLKFELKPDVLDECEKVEVEILDPIDQRLVEIEKSIADLELEIDYLTSSADKLDCSLAVASGILTGVLDVLVVGKWDFQSAKAWSSKEVNNSIIAFAQQHPKYKAFIENRKGANEENRLALAVQFLEKEFKLPGDGAWNFKGSSVTASSHHLDDLCHHPTIVGLICCVAVQFTGSTIYSDSLGNPMNLPITVNDYGNFVGRNPVEKMFSGVINWFLNVAKVMANRKGHIMSDLAGSYNSAKRKNEGMGLPGGFLSTLKELSALPCFRDSDFSTKLGRAFQNGIGTGKKQVDLGAFNALFEGASSKFDMRTEMAIGHELKRQAFPLVINEVLVRAGYFIRRFITELKETKNLLDINWRNVLPFKNRTVERMMTISIGVFHAVDLVDAVVEGAINSKGTWWEFGRQVVVRLNYPGVARFTISLGTEAHLSVIRSIKTTERMSLKAKALYLLDAKLYRGETLLWRAAEDTNLSLMQLSEVIKTTSFDIFSSIEDTDKAIEGISTVDVELIDEKNPGLRKSLLDLL